MLILSGATSASVIARWPSNAARQQRLIDRERRGQPQRVRGRRRQHYIDIAGSPNPLNSVVTLATA